GDAVVERTGAEAGGDGAGEDRSRRLSARTVRFDDQKRADDEREREGDLVEHASQKGLRQRRRAHRRRRHLTTIERSAWSREPIGLSIAPWLFPLLRRLCK